MNPMTREILERFDEVGAYEYPSGFDSEKLEQKAYNVGQMLQKLHINLTFECSPHIQDASFSVSIVLQDFEAVHSSFSQTPEIRFSNYGNLVTILFHNQLPEEVIDGIRTILNANDFTYLPETELDFPYDGTMKDKSIFSTWWHRYFDWI